MSFLDHQTKDWVSVLRSLVFLSGIFLILLIFSINLAKYTNADSVSVSAADGVSINFGINNSLSTMLVHPRGWQSSGIHINEDEILTIDASGSIHIAMGRMIQSLDYQYLVKDANEKDPSKNFSRDLDQFTKDELSESTFAYPWNGPEGIKSENLSNPTAISRIASLQETRVYPKARVGQLLAVIGSSNTEPPSIGESQVIPFNSSSEKTIIKESGFIWFIINDERPTNDPVKTRILWQDNLGMFSVNVVKQST